MGLTWLDQFFSDGQKYTGTFHHGHQSFSRILGLQTWKRYDKILFFATHNAVFSVEALLHSQGETSLVKVATGRYGSFVVESWNGII